MAAHDVLDALPRRPVPALPGPADGTGTGEVDWPGVDDPDALRALVARWLAGYARAQTRRTYAHALGLPPEWADAVTGVPPGPARPSSGHRPPPARRGRLHHLAFFRWCAARELDPRAVAGTDVTTWLHALDAAGAGRRTRARMLSTVSSFYAHLVEAGEIAGNPAALHRGRLGLAGSSRDPSPTIRLTAEQVRALWESAARLPNPTRARELYARRAVAFVALLTLGVRISEVTGLDRDDLVVTGGERVLRVRGKGGTVREVFAGDAVVGALTAYLAERDATTGAAPAARDVPGGPSPLLATRHGGRCSRHDLYVLLRRVAAHGGPALAEVADRVHPHALRHAYVTLALEAGAPIQHVQADVGHAGIATTRHYDRSRRSRATSASDLVTDLVTGA